MIACFFLYSRVSQPVPFWGCREGVIAWRFFSSRVSQPVFFFPVSRDSGRFLLSPGVVLLVIVAAPEDAFLSSSFP